MTRDVVGLVPAAGLGRRLGLGPKAFLKLGGDSLIGRIINILNGCVSRILVGVPTDYLDKARDELAGLAEIYPGGATRQATIFSLLQQCTEQIILIHDASCPFASGKLAARVIDIAKKDGAAVPFISTSSPVARYQAGVVNTSLPRAEIGLSQTPQAFHRELLERAYQNSFESKVETQSTWELVLRTGARITTVLGEPWNIKITTPLDWEIANKVIAPALDSNELGIEKLKGIEVLNNI